MEQITLKFAAPVPLPGSDQQQRATAAVVALKPSGADTACRVEAKAAAEAAVLAKHAEAAASEATKAQEMAAAAVAMATALGVEAVAAAQRQATAEAAAAAETAGRLAGQPPAAGHLERRNWPRAAPGIPVGALVGAAGERARERSTTLRGGPRMGAIDVRLLSRAGHASWRLWLSWLLCCS